ncbi:Hypothetical protein NGAL_HAMBI1145_29200 [Neorhizobium galegae bv. officinalis]|uniref:Uncharacterized protein n=1 Tax=Neorhizobium galegae bv. officinalis TaxID=323656 RepID=A0A0T7FKT4_NEOGA|nr:hypothetical protein [Neorhizobium galegae]CDZ35589.1 Hypothetical protein NGAL_HAMBI1145_29200 [Neorhizobium galegae bv. officinalis]
MMTDIRMKGLGTRNEVEEHLVELAEGAPTEDYGDGDPQAVDLDAAKREITWLRKEVADLRERLGTIRGQTEDVPRAPEDTHPWMRIAAAMATTFILGKLVQRLRLGAAGAAAVPMIAAQLDRRLW